MEGKSEGKGCKMHEREEVRIETRGEKRKIERKKKKELKYDKNGEDSKKRRQHYS